MLLWVEFCAEFITMHLYPCQKCSCRVLKTIWNEFNRGGDFCRRMWSVLWECFYWARRNCPSSLLRIAEPRVKNFPNNEAFVISGCPFSQAAFDCTCSVPYRWRFFFVGIFTFRLDQDKYEFSNWFHPPQMNACHSNFISYVSMFWLEIPKSYSYSIAYS